MPTKKAKPSDLGTGASNRAAKAIESRNAANAAAMAMARRFTNQTTDSNNKEKAKKPTRR